MADGQTLTPKPLPRRQKAAVILQFLHDNGISPDLAELSDDAQIALTREMGLIGQIDTMTIDCVIREFLDAVEQTGMSGPDGLSDAFAQISGTLSEKVQAKLKDEISGTDPWGAVRALPTATLRQILQTEGIEVASIILSQLPVDKAAEILGQIPGEHARRITYAMSRTNAVSAPVLGIIGTTINESYQRTSDPVFGDTPPKRLGAILTASQSQLRESLLDDLHKDDPAFTQEVRQSIFTFADIPSRIAPPDVPTIMRDVPRDITIPALACALSIAGPTTDAAAYLLSNLSKRLSEQMKEDIEAAPAPSATEGEQAQAKFISMVSDLASNGDIALIRAAATDGA
ncbi:hypothetical protein BVC71_04040 [Marivivens niveibacter]|uniref:Flagellar motor switch protein FliG n=1 Tax=Marivivens niveibacter TaxID=1930667 RepID=A0A251X1V2_9RHOB|nr:FliG C-terminal domain-containing protein [Marivivens niveibacter]OUD10667.1 hypothetical protein BVC71_04040 [Marivivens niveibacter]